MCNQRNCYPAAALFSQLCLLRDLSITVVLPHHILICDFAVQEGGVQRRMSRTTLCHTAISPHTLGGPHDSQFHSWINKYVHKLKLEVIIGGEILKEVALLLHDAVELINVDLTITVTVGLVDHVLELLIIDVLTELLS